MRKHDYTVESVDNALQILLLVRARGVLRLSDAAQELGVAHSTAHRLLHTMIGRGFVAQDERRRYVPGPEWSDVPGPTIPGGWRHLRLVARPYLERLRSEVGETVHLAVLDGGMVRFLASVEGMHALRVGSRVGVDVPAYVSSAGKVMLAALEPDRVRELYATDSKAPEPDSLERVLVAVRRRGYGTNIGESERGLSAVAVRVRGSDAAPLAAITVGAPTLRLPRARLPQLAEVVRRSTLLVEEALAATRD